MAFAKTSPVPVSDMLVKGMLGFQAWVVFSFSCVCILAHSSAITLIYQNHSCVANCVCDLPLLHLLALG